MNRKGEGKIPGRYIKTDVAFLVLYTVFRVGPPWLITAATPYTRESRSIEFSGVSYAPMAIGGAVCSRNGQFTH